MVFSLIVFLVNRSGIDWFTCDTVSYISSNTIDGSSIEWSGGTVLWIRFAIFLNAGNVDSGTYYTLFALKFETLNFWKSSGFSIVTTFFFAFLIYFISVCFQLDVNSNYATGLQYATKRNNLAIPHSFRCRWWHELDILRLWALVFICYVGYGVFQDCIKPGSSYYVVSIGSAQRMLNCFAVAFMAIVIITYMPSFVFWLLQ